MATYINFNITGELSDDLQFTEAQAAELLSKMEDLFLRTDLDLYDSEYNFDEE
jgi:hypothetical protein